MRHGVVDCGAELQNNEGGYLQHVVKDRAIGEQARRDGIGLLPWPGVRARRAEIRHVRPPEARVVRLPGFLADPADPVVAVAAWTGGAALLLTLLLLILVLLARLVALLSQWRRRRVLNRWRPLLMAGLCSDADALPRLPRRDLPVFLELWNHLNESLSSEAQASLARVAQRVRIPAAVANMLRAPGFRTRLSGVLTAGNLRLYAAWEDLRTLLASESPLLSQAAARALTRIDAARAMPLLMPHIVARRDWIPQKVDEILREAGAEYAAKPLLEAIPAVPPELARRLIRYLGDIAPAAAAETVSKVLANPAHQELLAECLELTADSRDLPSVRQLARHPDWQIREQAATALGRIGVAADEALLVELLGDQKWWVRYRAAAALSRLPGMGIAELRRIKNLQTDRYARDILHQVIAELELWQDSMAEIHG